MSKAIKGMLTLLMAVIVLGFGAFTYLDLYGGTSGLSEQTESGVTLQFWYTDSSMTSYYNNAASYFNKRNEGITIVPTLVDSAEYLDDIYEASVEGASYPDLYVISDDSLGKAYLAGLTVPVTGEELDTLWEEFSTVAISAVSYEGKVLGYPFYFNTSTLVYNETYLQQIANGETASSQDDDDVDLSTADLEDGEDTSQEEEDSLEDTSQESTQAADAQEEMSAETETGESSLEGGASAESDSAETTDEEAGSEETASDDTNTSIEALVPVTVGELLDLANNYEAPDGVEYLFKWDVNDVFYNYYFVGGQIVVDGSSASDVDINTEGAINCLTIFQDLTEFFYVDPDEVDADSILEEFLEGKVLFTIMDINHALQLEEAAAEGTMTFDYGYSVIPHPSDVWMGAALSVTQVVVVNGYSEHAEAAAAFAAFLTGEYGREVENLYASTGHVSANKTVEKTTELEEVFSKEYERSTCLPKNPAVGNFWMLLENTFSNVWEGESIETELLTLEDQVKAQYAAD